MRREQTSAGILPSRSGFTVTQKSASAREVLNLDALANSRSRKNCRDSKLRMPVSALFRSSQMPLRSIGSRVIISSGTPTFTASVNFGVVCSTGFGLIVSKCHSLTDGTGKAISRVGSGLKMSGSSGLIRLLFSGMLSDVACGAKSGRMI